MGSCANSNLRNSPIFSFSHFLCLHFSEGPLALAEDGNGLAVAGDGVDVQTLIADHEINVDHGFVDAKLAALVQRLVLKALDGVSKARAYSQVAGGVLIKQGFVERSESPREPARTRPDSPRLHPW